MKTKAEVDAELERLESRLRAILQESPAGDELEAFASEAEILTEQPPAGMEAYISDRINCMLASAGLIPGETEDEPCESSDKASDQ